MNTITIVIVSIIMTLELSAVTATKVVQCKSTYRGKLKEPGVADHRSLCTLSSNFPDYSDLCISTDTRGDISAYYSVADDLPTLCVTLIYKEDNITELFASSIVLFRGVSQLINTTTCDAVCSSLKSLIEAVPDITIIYLGCVPKENGNDEDVSKIDFSKPTGYTCKTPDNYAKPGDLNRPGPPGPIRTTTTSTIETTTASTTKTTTPITTTKAEPGTPVESDSAPSWMWPVIGALAALLAIMAVGLIVEVLLSRSTFNEISKTKPSNDMPMSETKY